MITMCKGNMGQMGRYPSFCGGGDTALVRNALWGHHTAGISSQLQVLVVVVECRIR
jgi:hypothetical protein